MVSLRRRRLLGLCCGPNGYVTPLPFLTAEEMITGIPNPNGVAAYSPVPKEEKTPIVEGSRSQRQRTPSKYLMQFRSDSSAISPDDYGSISPKLEQDVCDSGLVCQSETCNE